MTVVVSAELTCVQTNTEYVNTNLEYCDTL